MDKFAEIKFKIKNILIKYSEDYIEDDTTIINKKYSLLDSLNIMEFICELEKTFDIDDIIIKDISLANFNTVSTLASYILKIKRNEGNG